MPRTKPKHSYRRKPSPKRIYLWESMCGMFQSKEALRQRNIHTPKELLIWYIKRQARREKPEYVLYCLNNSQDALKMATEVYNYRTGNFEDLMDWEMIDGKA